MSRILIAFVACVALALAATACERASDATKSAGQAVNDAAKVTGKALDTAAKATGQAVENAAENTGEALEAAGDYVNRHKLVQVSQDQFQNLKSNWHELVGKAESSGRAAESRFQDLSDRMAQGLDDADRKLTVVKDASADAWQDAKSALDGALRKTQELYEYVAVEFGS